jgi:hypothetical protein
MKRGKNVKKEWKYTDEERMRSRTITKYMKTDEEL